MLIGRKSQEGNGEDLGVGDVGSQSRPIVLSQHKNQEKVSQSHPHIKASDSSQLGICLMLRKRDIAKTL